MIGIGVIGYGYWGPNLVRNFSEVPGSRVVAVSDTRSERLKQVQDRYPAIKTTTDHRELLNDARIDAIVIATPVSTHFDLSMQALHAGIEERNLEVEQIVGGHGGVLPFATLETAAAAPPPAAQ